MKKKEIISIIQEMNSEIKLEHYVPKKLAKKLLFNELIHKYKLDKIYQQNKPTIIIPDCKLTSDIPYNHIYRKLKDKSGKRP